MNSKVTQVYIITKTTLTVDAALFPNLSIIYPINKAPTISPMPKETIENKDFIIYCSSESSGIVITIIGISNPVYIDRDIPVHII